MKQNKVNFSTLTDCLTNQTHHSLILVFFFCFLLSLSYIHHQYHLYFILIAIKIQCHPTRLVNALYIIKYKSFLAAPSVAPEPQTDIVMAADTTSGAVNFWLLALLFSVLPLLWLWSCWWLSLDYSSFTLLLCIIILIIILYVNNISSMAG